MAATSYGVTGENTRNSQPTGAEEICGAAWSTSSACRNTGDFGVKEAMEDGRVNVSWRIG